MTDLDPVLERIDAALPAALDRLCALLAIPSISTDPAHKADCARAAEWLAGELSALGFTAATRETPGQPMVVAHGDGPGPHLLFYGHYDVQPADPLELWDNDPFDPRIEETPAGRVIRARGASDDKGQLMTFVEACRAWHGVHGTLPARLTILFEGEEESGSPSLPGFLSANAEELKADLALICDTGLFDAETPAIVTQLRGLVGEEVTVRAAARDLHSGMYGGLATNPARALAAALGRMHDAEGRVAIPGFYDDVEEISDELRTAWQALGFDAAAFLGDVGLSRPAGEAGRLPLECLWSRPTAEINGLVSGYTGPGFKTVLPGAAHAKISFRLVANQDPERLRGAFRDWLREQLPADCTAEFTAHGGAPASRMNTDAPSFAAARAALSAEWPRPAAFVGSGGSIPIAGMFKETLAMESLLAGFGRDDDAIHSPNEKYDVESFRRGARSWARILAAIAAEGG